MASRNEGGCLSCRVVGTGVCLGLSVYITLRTLAQNPASPSQRIVNLFMAGGFAAMGIARGIVE